MNKYLHICYLAEFFLEWEMFQTKFVEKIKTHILYSITCSLKSCCLWDNMEKYGRAGQAIGDNAIQRTRFACWIIKVTDTHWECVILIAFHGNNGYTNAPQCCVILTLPVLFSHKLRNHSQCSDWQLAGWPGLSSGQFSFRYVTQHRCGTQATSYLMSVDVKWLESDSDHLLQFTAEVKMRGALPPFPCTSTWLRDNDTLNYTS
jgi:hypothetical protein